MIPLRDLNPSRRFPILTFSLIGINVLVFLWEQTLSVQQLQAVLLRITVVPAQLTADPFSVEALLDSVRSMFLHGGWAHLLGNMLYLYLFGDNVEDRLGRPLFILFYLVSGFAAIVAQVAIDPSSPIPLVGASGAIAGVLGGYLVLFPRVQVRGIIPLGILFYPLKLPAWVVLGFWFVVQLFNGAASLAPDVGGMGGGVAFFAHVGGFVIGAILMWLFTMVMPQPPEEERNEMLYERAQRYRY